MIDEITEKGLTEHCQRCLKIKVSDTTQAVVILEKYLHTSNYEVIDDKVIRIFDFIDEPGMVNTILSQNGIVVLESIVSRNTLEDYFNEKMKGGVLNA